MKDKEPKRLVLSKFHPFTPRQAQIIEHVISGGTTDWKEIGKELRIRPNTVKNMIAGTNDLTPSIRDRIRKYTGRNPSYGQWFLALLDDVVFLRNNK